MRGRGRGRGGGGTHEVGERGGVEAEGKEGGVLQSRSEKRIYGWRKDHGTEVEVFWFI